MGMIRFYFDEMMSRIVASKLTEEGYDVVMAVDVGMMDKDDDTEHLVYAKEHSLVLVTQDRPFAGRTSKHADHAGLICWVGDLNDFGNQIRLLKEFAGLRETDDVKGMVFWLK
jgi:predicted nuclease of predicted toxin-antitoxin system